MGGEEFALILPDTGGEAAFALAEHLRIDLREEFAKDPTPLTISFGLSVYPEHAETAASLIHAADQALYAAKENGRNQTVLHSRRYEPNCEYRTTCATSAGSASSWRYSRWQRP